jgi:hypothetical protein
MYCLPKKAATQRASVIAFGAFGFNRQALQLAAAV